MEYLSEGCVKNNEVLPTFGKPPMSFRFWNYDSAKTGYLADFLPEAAPESKAPGSFYEEYSRVWPIPQPDDRRDEEEDEDERDFDPERNGRDTIGRIIKNARSAEIIKSATSDEPWSNDWESGQPDKVKYDIDHSNDSSRSSGGYGNGSNSGSDYNNNSYNEFNCPTHDFW